MQFKGPTQINSDGRTRFPNNPLIIAGPMMSNK